MCTPIQNPNQLTTIFGSGYVPEEHSDETHRNLPPAEREARRRRRIGDGVSEVPELRVLGVAEQVLKRVRSALDLKQLGIGDRAERADDGIAGADHDRRVRIGRTRAGLKLARETVMQAFERRLARLRQVEIGKQPPAGDRQVADQGVLDLAEPPHEPGQRRPRDAIGQEKVKIFLL